MSKPKVTAMDLLGIMPNPYPDIPSEYQLGLARGALGDWLQEVVSDRCYMTITPEPFRLLTVRAQIVSYDSGEKWIGSTMDGEVSIALTRAYIAWKGRE